MAADAWPQRLIRFTDWSRAEATAVEHLLPVLIAQESELAQWSFLRKYHWWRLRYRPAGPDSAKVLDAALDELVDAGVLASWTPGIYEPEETAFGGPAAMKVAHTLFHYDSRHLLDEAARQQTASGPQLGRRELAVSCSAWRCERRASTGTSRATSGRRSQPNAPATTSARCNGTGPLSTG
jgi:protein-L-isoaspartate(D-aspartate) O-methyltransferase